MDTFNRAKSKLTSAEIGNVWNSYILESMVHHIFVYYANNAEDKDIAAYIDYDTASSSRHLSNYIEIFKKEDLPIPRGTVSEDFNANAPRLYTDKFYVIYIKSLAKFALSSAIMAYTESARDDVRALFRDYIDRLIPIEQKVTDILIAKGMYPTPPKVDVLDDVEFVESNHFFAGYFGEKRPLSVLEIKQLFNNVHSNQLGKVLLTGFKQVAKSNEVKEYFEKGIEIADKLVKVYSQKLLDEGISIPSSLESEVLEYSSDEVPFSDRLMLNHVVFLNAYGIGNKGLSLAQSQRNDLSMMYGKYLVEIGLYAKAGAELLVKNKWLEQPPIIKK